MTRWRFLDHAVSQIEHVTASSKGMNNGSGPFGHPFPTGKQNLRIEVALNRTDRLKILHHPQRNVLINLEGIDTGFPSERGIAAAGTPWKSDQRNTRPRRGDLGPRCALSERSTSA